MLQVQAGEFVNHYIEVPLTRTRRVRCVLTNVTQKNLLRRRLKQRVKARWQHGGCELMCMKCESTCGTQMLRPLRLCESSKYRSYSGKYSTAEYRTK